METTTEIEIADEHTDELDHLNHVEAVRLLELAREDWYAACGLYIDKPEGEWPLSAVVVNVNYNYRLECFSGRKNQGDDPAGLHGNQELYLRA